MRPIEELPSVSPLVKKYNAIKSSNTCSFKSIDTTDEVTSFSQESQHIGLTNEGFMALSCS